MATTTTAASAHQLRSLYRSLLRELPPRRILSRAPSPLHRSLRASFREPTTTTSSPSSPTSTSPTTTTTTTTVRANLDLARELATYLRAQRTYVGLIERYNPGMGMDEEERVRLTARRVGMDLPVEFDPRGGGGAATSS